MGFITALGFLTFGQNAAGLVLNNYASKDSWMSLSRVAVAISLVFSYPLAFQGCRDGILDLLQVPAEKKNNAAFLNLTTVALLSVLTLLAAVLTDVKIVLALGGAVRLHYATICLHCTALMNEHANCRTCVFDYTARTMALTFSFLFFYF
jgi:hypothetical protein